MKEVIMKNLIIVMAILCIGLIVLAMDNSNVNKREVSLMEDIPGTGLIKDKQFCKTLLIYLSLDEKLNYEEIYKYLSTEFLKEYFPEVKNAKDYKDIMEDTSERSAPKYLEITKWTKVNDFVYEVGLSFSANTEGVEKKLHSTYYFINEEGKWKYNGLKL